MAVIIEQLSRTGEMWMYPVDRNLVLSVLGNLYTGYEGSPGVLWKVMKIFSLAFLSVVFISLLSNFKKRREDFILFLLWLFVPAAAVIAISFVKPIFVNRYLISGAVAEVFLITLAISLIKAKMVRRVLILLLAGFSLFYLIYHPGHVKKVDLKTTFAKINQSATSQDYVYANSPLVFFESRYYFKDEKRVFLYNPERVKLPNYLGIILIPEEKQRFEFPRSSGVYIVGEDGSYSYE